MTATTERKPKLPPKPEPEIELVDGRKGELNPAAISTLAALALHLLDIAGDDDGGGEAVEK